jgi:hypothetical protein
MYQVKTIIFHWLILASCCNCFAVRISHFVYPHTTDSTIKLWDRAHYIVTNTTAKKRGLLFLFLPGTGNVPHGYRHIANQAAGDGFHAINLHYPNEISVNFTCAQYDNMSCYEKMRLEIIEGRDLSPLVDISRENSIENRLIQLLLYLQTYLPNEGWANFIDSAGNPRWARIIVAGHSQGGSHAALIAKKHKIAGVIMFSSADYNSRQKKAAPWIASPGKTPLNRYFAMGHRRDRAFPLSTQLAVWRTLGILKLGPVAEIDSIDPPYSPSHAFITNLPPAHEAPSETPFHNAVVTDDDTPKNEDGSARLAPDWSYMLKLELQNETAPTKDHGKK